MPIQTEEETLLKIQAVIKKIGIEARKCYEVSNISEYNRGIADTCEFFAEKLPEILKKGGF